MLPSEWATVAEPLPDMDEPLPDITMLNAIEAARDRYNQVTPAQLKYLRQIKFSLPSLKLLDHASVFDCRGDANAAMVCLETYNRALTSALSVCPRHGEG